MESTVVVRASLVGEGEPFSKVATGNDTPWEAELVTIAGGGVKEGDGFLKTNGYKKLSIIGNGFGYIHLPEQLITPELEKAPDNTSVHFVACLNRIPDSKDKNAKYLALCKWRAVSVEIKKANTQSTGRPIPVAAPDIQTVEVSSSDSDEDLICDDAIIELLKMQIARDLAAKLLPGPNGSKPTAIDSPEVPRGANFQSTATGPISIDSSATVPFAFNKTSKSIKSPCPKCGPLICWCKN